ncbi:MAG: 4-hydroxythreonine-4-phosphate dehydrogenase PdxA, partial [Pseudomonadota bacterium]
HEAIRDVPSLITAEAIDETVRILDDGLRSSFGLPSPRIAVSGLNPHAGEAGTIGCEDRDIIEPSIKTLVADGIHVTGPHSADTMFHREAREAYDAALTMFHDQALIPVKTLAFDTGVNVTLGLAFIRTSPDHGTAFELAGTGRANPASLISALRLADQLASNPMPAMGVQ